MIGVRRFVVWGRVGVMVGGRGCSGVCSCERVVDWEVV